MCKIDVITRFYSGRVGDAPKLPSESAGLEGIVWERQNGKKNLASCAFDLPSVKDLPQPRYMSSLKHSDRQLKSSESGKGLTKEYYNAVFLGFNSKMLEAAFPNNGCHRLKDLADSEASVHIYHNGRFDTARKQNAPASFDNYLNGINRALPTTDGPNDESSLPLIMNAYQSVGGEDFGEAPKENIFKHLHGTTNETSASVADGSYALWSLGYSTIEAEGMKNLSNLGINADRSHHLAFCRPPNVNERSPSYIYQLSNSLSLEESDGACPLYEIEGNQDQAPLHEASSSNYTRYHLKKPMDTVQRIGSMSSVAKGLAQSIVAALCQWMPSSSISSPENTLSASRVKECSTFLELALIGSIQPSSGSTTSGEEIYLSPEADPLKSCLTSKLSVRSLKNHEEVSKVLKKSWSSRALRELVKQAKLILPTSSSRAVKAPHNTQRSIYTHTNHKRKGLTSQWWDRFFEINSLEDNPLRSGDEQATERDFFQNSNISLPYNDFKLQTDSYRPFDKSMCCLRVGGMLELDDAQEVTFTLMIVYTIFFFLISNTKQWRTGLRTQGLMQRDIDRLYLDWTYGTNVNIAKDNFQIWQRTWRILGSNYTYIGFRIGLGALPYLRRQISINQMWGCSKGFEDWNERGDKASQRGLKHLKSIGLSRIAEASGMNVMVERLLFELFYGCNLMNESRRLDARIPWFRMFGLRDSSIMKEKGLNSRKKT